MNYTLKQLRDRVDQLIANQGEDAHCGAWIYTKEDCHLKDENGEFDYDNVVEDPELIERIFDDVGNVDYIYQVIQECVDEVTEEQQELDDHIYNKNSSSPRTSIKCLLFLLSTTQIR